MFSSVCRVEVSSELDTAKVWVSVYGDEKSREDSLEGLRSAASFLQSEISREIRLRRIPRLRFFYDESLERGLRIEDKLKGLEASDANAEADEEASDEPSGS